MSLVFIRGKKRKANQIKQDYKKTLINKSSTSYETPLSKMCKNHATFKVNSIASFYYELKLTIDTIKYVDSLDSLFSEQKLMKTSESTLLREKYFSKVNWIFKKCFKFKLNF